VSGALVAGLGQGLRRGRAWTKETRRTVDDHGVTDVLVSSWCGRDGGPYE
jgi:hypothetical protein